MGNRGGRGFSGGKGCALVNMKENEWHTFDKMTANRNYENNNYHYKRSGTEHKAVVECCEVITYVVKYIKI